MQARRKRWQGKFDSRNLHEEFRVIVLEGWSPIKGNEGHEGLKKMELGAGIGIRGKIHLSSLATPLDMRVRIRRFGGLSYDRATTAWSPRESKKALESARCRAGEFAIRHGPCALPAVWAARSLRTPRLRSSLNLVRPRFHCFHTTDRSRRCSHIQDFAAPTAFGTPRSSRASRACRRSPEVSSIAFNAQPSDLPPVYLMDMGFAAICPLARYRRPLIRFLFIGSRLCSTLLSGPASRRVLFHLCASL